jgi:putative endonuclease
VTSQQPTPAIATTPSTWWLYLLQCQDGRTYAGIALDVCARYKQHLDGKASKFTRANKPVGILGAQAFATRSEASKAEYALKQLSKPEKLSWAQQHRANPAIAGGHVTTECLDDVT